MILKGLLKHVNTKIQLEWRVRVLKSYAFILIRSLTFLDT